jgi:hypothetical protein
MGFAIMTVRDLYGIAHVGPKWDLPNLGPQWAYKGQSWAFKVASMGYWWATLCGSSMGNAQFGPTNALYRTNLGPTWVKMNLAMWGLLGLPTGANTGPTMVRLVLC